MFVWVSVAVIAAVVGVGFLLFRDGSADIVASDNKSMDAGAEMMVPAPGMEGVDEMIVDESGMMEDASHEEGENMMMEQENADKSVEIMYTDGGFTPTTLNIAKGATVRFVNKSSRDVWPASALHPSHTVYDSTSLSEHCPNADGTAFDACKGVAPGASWSFTFTKAGEWKYHDHLNPRNFGSVIVK